MTDHLHDPLSKARVRATTNGGKVARITYMRTEPKPSATRFAAFTRAELDVLFDALSHHVDDFPKHFATGMLLLDEVEREPSGGESP